MASDASHHPSCDYKGCHPACEARTLPRASDDADREAAELLPCLRGCGPLHMLDCPVAYRPAVAAALRARDEKIEKLKADLDEEVRDYYALEAERDALRAALEEAIGKYDDGSWRHDDIFKLARAAQRPKP